MGRSKRREILQKASTSDLESLFEDSVESEPVQRSDRVRWAFETGDEIQSSPTVVGGTVFVGSDDQNLYAIDADTGDQLWAFDADQAVRSAPTVNDGVVYAATDGSRFVAVDIQTGEVVWEKEAINHHFRHHVCSSPRVVDGTIYVGMPSDRRYASEEEFDELPGGYVYAIDSETGEMEWYTELEEEASSSPTVVDDVVYIGCENHKVYAFEATDGEKRWEFNTGDVVRSSPSVVDGVVYIACMDTESENVFALDASTGEGIWSTYIADDPDDEFTSGAEIWSSPTVHNETVYVTTGSGLQPDLYALDADTGEEQWSAIGRTHSHSSPTVADDTVFFGDDSGHILAMDAANGDERWVIETNGTIYSSPTVVDGVLYVGSQDGHVYAIETGSDGSSEGSRVATGTLGHHDSLEGASAPNLETTDDEMDDPDSGDDPGEGSDETTGSDDSLPGPGILGSVASLGGVGYLLKRRLDDEEKTDE